jgi:hypothetical protein
MVETIQARDITLHDLETKFGLTHVENDQFFREWQDDLPEISDLEKQRLDRVNWVLLPQPNLPHLPPIRRSHTC